MQRTQQDTHAEKVVATRLGRYVSTVAFDETVNAYVPPALPPVPPLALSDRLLRYLGEADRAIGRLDGVAMLLPDKAPRKTCCSHRSDKFCNTYA